MLVGIPFDDGLNQMMNMVRSVCVNLLSLINDNLLGGSLSTSVPSSVQRSEHSLVFIGSDVTFCSRGGKVRVVSEINRSQEKAEGRESRRSPTESREVGGE